MSLNYYSETYFIVLNIRDIKLVYKPWVMHVSDIMHDNRPKMSTVQICLVKYVTVNSDLYIQFRLG